MSGFACTEKLESVTHESFLNTYVEKDAENRLKLRRDMRRVDKMFTHRQGRHVLFGEGPSVFQL